MSPADVDLHAGTGAKERPPSPFDEKNWTARLSVLAFGVRVGVRVDDATVVDELTNHFPPGATTSEFSDAGLVYSLVCEERERQPSPRYSLFADAKPLVQRVTLAATLRAFEAALQIHVAEMSPERVFVHAGVVGWQGRAILLPGRSFSGKSTLVAELVRAGADYYSDEYAALDPTGEVHPYCRALSIREKGGVTRYPVDALGGHEGSGPLPVGLIVVSKYIAGSEWRPQAMSPGRSALALLANTVPARRVPGLVMSTLQRVVSVATTVSTDRGEALSVVDPILALAGRAYL